MSEAGRRRATPERSGGRGLVLGLIGLMVLAAVGYFGLKAAGLLPGGGSADYSGAGTPNTSHDKSICGGAVTCTIQVRPGETAQEVSKALKDAGVVASQTAFIDAANANPGWKGVHACSYALNPRMKASLAVAWMVDPSHCVNGITIQEGWRTPQVIAAITAKSHITAAELRAALARPASIGLPTVAQGDVEGYLWPATYSVVAGQTATQLLAEMVSNAKTQLIQAGIEAGSPTGNLTPRQVLTLASIIQAESGGSDMSKVARVFYNRLAQGMMLQSDATVAFANNLSGTVWTTDAQRNNPSPYNTYVHKGLPPGPIDNPGLAAIQAALHPASGPWLYFVPINLKTGETVYSTTYAEHQAAVAQLQAWCAQTHYVGCK